MLSVGSFAQDSEFVEEVVSIGTRGKPRSVSSSPVPVDVLSAEDISKTGTDDLAYAASRQCSLIKCSLTAN